MGPNSGELILVTGGARSGKSTFAEKYAAASGKKVIYVATAAGRDEEMRRRIADHQKRRPPQFYTVEEPYYPHQVLEKESSDKTLILLDCLTLLLTNHLLKAGETAAGEAAAGEDFFLWSKQAAAVLKYIEEFLVVVRRSLADVVIVTNEVGSGLVPGNLLGRVYRDLAGKANQLVAAEADQVWLLVSGIAQQLK